MSTADLHPVNERTSLIRPVLEKPLPGPRDISPGRRYGILAGIWAGTFLSSLNLTLVSTLLPLISADFHNSNQASWLGTAYLLAACTFTPLYGRLCNVMGRRAATQTAVIFSVLGTTLCGLAPSMEMLIAARFLGGLGGGGIITTTKVITSDLYSLRSRGFTQGIAALFVGLGMGLGVPLGGLIGDLLGWRWAFLLQTPLFAFPLFMTSVNIQYSTPSMGKGAFDVLKRIDYGGALTLMATVFSFLSFLGARFNTGLPMHDPTVLASLVCAIIFFFAFVGWELYVATEPMLAPSLLQEKVPVLVGMSNFLVDFSNYGIAYFFPMWFQTVMQTSASEAGMHLLPNSIAMAFGSLFSGWIMHRTGRFKMLDVFIGFFPFVASILIMRLRPDSSPTALWLSIIPLGFGNSVVLQTMLIALLAHIPADAVAVGTGFALLFRGLGQVAGVGVASAIFQYHLDAALKLRITGPNADAMVSQIRHSIAFVSNLPVAMQAEARISYAFALRAVFIAISVASLVGYVVRLLVPERDLDERPRSEHEFGPAPIMVGISTARLMTIVEESSPKSTFYDEAEEPLRALPSRPGEAYRKVVVSLPSNIV